MRTIAAATLSLLLAGPALAQQPAVTEETLERGLVNLGLMAGHAFQCTPEAARPEMQRMLLEFNAILVAQMGANAAFRWATAFGAGSATEVDRSFCERSLADWQRHAQQNRLVR